MLSSMMTAIYEGGSHIYRLNWVSVLKSQSFWGFIQYFSVRIWNVTLKEIYVYNF